jgi:hypothetical protein
MSDLETLPAEVALDPDERTETGEPTAAHIVKVGPGENAAAVVVEARVMGTPVEALCGFVWVPSRDPKQLPMCEGCKGIYAMYRSFNEHLGDEPST